MKKKENIDKLIEERLRLPVKIANMKVQRALLLDRNRMFDEELKGITMRLGPRFFRVKRMQQEEHLKKSKSNILLKYDYPPVRYYRSKSEVERDRYFPTDDLDWPGELKPAENYLDMIVHKNTVLLNYFENWDYFCRRWGIDPMWDASRKGTLALYQGNPVEIFHNPATYPPIEADAMVIIGIRPGARKKDLLDIWDVVKPLLKKISDKVKGISNFGRDLCWLDLSMGFGLKPVQIVKLWTKEYPRDIDILVVRKMKEDRYFSESELEKFVAEENEDKALVDSIKKGGLGKEKKDAFDRQRKIYITGIDPIDNKTAGLPPLADAIRQAISRLTQQIKALNLPAPKYPGHYFRPDTVRRLMDK